MVGRTIVFEEWQAENMAFKLSSWIVDESSFGGLGGLKSIVYTINPWKEIHFEVRQLSFIKVNYSFVQRNCFESV